MSISGFRSLLPTSRKVTMPSTDPHDFMGGAA
jgi:hypothetical protein